MFQCKKFGQSIQHANFFFANLALSHCPKICFSEDVQKTLENEEMRYKESGMQLFDDNYSCTKQSPRNIEMRRLYASCAYTCVNFPSIFFL